MSKPTGQPRTDALFHELSVAHYGETPMQRAGRVEHALILHAAKLEQELTNSEYNREAFAQHALKKIYDIKDQLTRIGVMK